jgi:hypothetical protein
MTRTTATGSVHIRGAYDSNGTVVNITNPYNQPTLTINRPIEGVVVGDKPIQVGGCSDGDRLKNYQGFTGWSNMVEIPVGAKFKITITDGGDTYNFAKFNIEYDI